MLFSTIAAVLALSTLTGLSARPLTKRDGAGPAPGDIVVLSFAGVLENLETEFYTQATSKFQSSDFTSSGFASADIATQQLTSILTDESAHVKFINSSLAALGGTPISGCKFDFSSVLGSLDTALATARVVEHTGVAAYMGAANLISDKQILTDAASIMTVEARHQSILNILSGSGTAIPQAFDVALAPNEVLAIASPFISGCSLGIQANTPLTITTQNVAVGSSLSFQYANMPSDISKLSCQMIIGGSVNAISLPANQCVVPSTVNGPVAIYITNDASPLANNVLNRNQAQVVAGPTIAFIDAKPEDLGGIVRGSSSQSTITPAQAASVEAGASSSYSSSSGSSSSSSGSSSTSGPVLTTGASPDGASVVVGWQNIPANDQ